MSDNKTKRKLSISITALLFLTGAAYIHGIRFISLEEVPSSHRPWQLYLSADYAGKHLTEETAYNKSDADWLSQLAK